MAQTYNERLLDAMISHQIGLLRFSSGVRRRIWEILDATEVDLAAQASFRASRAGFATRAQREALRALLERLRKTRLKAWEEVTELFVEEMKSFAVAETRFLAGTITGIVPVELGLILPTAAHLRTIATATPFQGRRLAEWAKKMQADDLDRIETAVRIGLVQGDTGAQIARRIVGTRALQGRDGVTQTTRRHASTLARTVANGIGAASRREFATANDHLGMRELFVATLDSRTTPICRRYDGKTFDVGKGPVLPLHFNERSLYTFVFDGEVIGERPHRDFTRRSLLRDFTKSRGLSPVTKRDLLPYGTKGDFDAFARRRMRELTGRVPAKTTYGEWLKRQTVENQNDILGVTRARLFRRGGLKIEKFVDRAGDELTLAQLAKRHSDAFRAAGLDPAKFL